MTTPTTDTDLTGLRAERDQLTVELYVTALKLQVLRRVIVRALPHLMSRDLRKRMLAIGLLRAALTSTAGDTCF